MEIRPMHRAVIAALLSATGVVAVAGCTAPRTMSASQPAGGDEKPKKEYQWKDMSTGKSFFRPIEPSKD